MQYKSLSDLLDIAAQKKEPPFILILDGIEDPQNFGAILRSAEGAGVHGVVFRKARQAPISETVRHVSTGAVDLVPIARVANIAEAIRFFKNEGLVVFGVEIDGKRLYNEPDYRGGIALVIGSEGKGLAHLVKERVSEVVKLPMRGRINSLNVSVAAGIALYEVLRQRGTPKA